MYCYCLKVLLVNTRFYLVVLEVLTLEEKVKLQFALRTPWRRWVVTMSQPLCPPPQGNNLHHPLNRRLGGPQSPSDILGKRKISCLCWELNPGSSSHSLVTIQMTNIKLDLLIYFSDSQSFLIRGPIEHQFSEDWNATNSHCRIWIIVYRSTTPKLFMI
jgi:hypothetical protein